MVRPQEVEKLRNTFALSERNPKKITNQELGELTNNLLLLYKAYYGASRGIPIREAPSTLPDQHIPRGTYFRETPTWVAPDRRGIQEVLFGNEWIAFIKGDPEFVYPGNPQGVYRSVFSHELAHSQTEPKTLVGVQAPSLKAKEVGHPGQLHYIIGFKAVSIDPSTGDTNPVTYNLNEWVAQYLAMSMLGNFERIDPILEQMKRHGQGIDAETILGAETLNKIFRRMRIQPQQVELLHRQSNLRGFMALLDKARRDMGRDVVRAGKEIDRKVALDKLVGVEARLKK